MEVHGRVDEFPMSLHFCFPLHPVDDYKGQVIFLVEILVL